jgi:hypothetical protein
VALGIEPVGSGDAAGYGAMPGVARLIGPPEADGEYVALRDGDSGEEIVHLHDYERLYRVPGMGTS